MSIRNLARSFCLLGLCATQVGIASAETPTVMMAAAAAKNNSSLAAQSAQVPAKPASMQVGSAAPGALPGPAPATLWRFMGVPQGIRKLQGATRNRNGNRPNREPRPPLKAIADPANLQSGNLPIETAAKIKQQEDLAPQKIKALKYLATIGCGCYKGVKEAFMDALDDCTEEVRLQAAESIAEAADTKCAKCSNACCCDAEMMQKLNDVATLRDDKGCFVEPSAEVRAAACQALLACRRRVPVYPAPVVPGPPPETQETVPVNPEAVPDMPTPPNQASTGQSADLISEMLGVAPVKGKSVKSITSATMVSTPVMRGPSAGQPQSPISARSGTKTGILQGAIVGIDVKTSPVDVEFDGRLQPTVGSQFSVLHDYALSTVNLGRIEIVYLAGNGRAIARPVGRTDLAKLGKGDRVDGRIVAHDDASQSTANQVTAEAKKQPILSRLASMKPQAVPQPSRPLPFVEEPTPSSSHPVRSLLAGFMKGSEETVTPPSTKKGSTVVGASTAALPALPVKAPPPALKSQSAQRAQPAAQSHAISDVSRTDTKKKPAASPNKVSSNKPSRTKASSAGILLLEE